MTAKGEAKAVRRTGDRPSVNALAAPLVGGLLKDAAALGVAVETLENGCVLVDGGRDAPGSLEAGRRIAEICLGGMGQVSISAGSPFPDWPWKVDVHTAQPVLACLGSQYAGWSLSHGSGKEAFRALGSGPARAIGSSEALFDELGYRDKSDSTCLVLEVDQHPPVPVLDQVCRKCGIAPPALTVIITPTQSLCGSVQIVARSLEVALHKVHTLEFPLEYVVDGMGSAPLPSPATDFMTAMGRTNDAILFGAQVQLFVRGSDEAAADLAKRLPSSASRDYGKPFAQVFKDYDYDFFKIDPMLFSPARVTVTALESGRSFHAGKLDPELLKRSFGGTHV
jgi:methenyltetrahydromethanopterin cyclohydrolase